MTSTTDRASMYERIESHGRNLLAIFPNATERDPVKLCKKLRRLERQGQELALRLCNGPDFDRESEPYEIGERILTRVQVLLGYSTIQGLGAYVPVFLNRDPRGYSLKIESEAAADLNIHRDWGGYGIIAPDLS